MSESVNPFRIADYVSQEDRSKPIPDQTIFKLRPLTAAEHAAVSDMFFAPGKSVQALVQAASLALVGWLNLKDHAGADVPFPIEGQPNTARPIDYVHPKVRTELGRFVITANAGSDALLEKSKPGSASPAAS